MKHPRTLIRETVASLLSANLPKVDARITAARISIHRSTPLFAAKLPAVLIYTRDERIEDQPNADPGLRHRLLELSQLRSSPAVRQRPKKLTPWPKRWKLSLILMRPWVCWSRAHA